VAEYLKDIDEAYSLLYSLDREYMERIKPQDIYRVEKSLEIYLETGLTPTRYFQLNPPKPIIDGDIDIYEIDVDRDTLRERIALRTEEMFKRGAIF